MQKLFILLALLAVSTVSFASDLQTAHSEYLVATKNAQLLQGQHYDIEIVGCHNCEKVKASLYILKNKYSLYACHEEKVLKQQGAFFATKEKVDLLTDTQVVEKKLKFQITFIEGTIAVRSSEKKFENLILHFGAQIHSLVLHDATTGNYEKSIKALVEAEKPFFHILLHDKKMVSNSRYLHCPNCGYNGYGFVKWCTWCNTCVNGINGKCELCGKSGLWTGKMCNKCGTCYK